MEVWTSPRMQPTRPRFALFEDHAACVVKNCRRVIAAYRVEI